MAGLSDLQRRIAKLSNAAKADTVRKLSVEAQRLYQVGFDRKVNPYGEPWVRSPMDLRNRPRSRIFGKLISIDAESFRLAVSSPSPGRSCIPVPTRGLGSWCKPFGDILFADVRRIILQETA